MGRFGKGVFAAIIALLAVGWADGAAPQAPAPFGWSGDPDDARPDPAARYGALANGMRYIIRRNASPPGEVSMRLVILAGSMQESPGQEGLAHFVEHMAFHGSKSIPDGEMQRSLERLGLRMGGDLNANTAQVFTVYRFDLAKGGETTLDTSLLLLREIGSDLKLEAAAMDVERPVIAAEARSRSASDLAASEALLRAEVGDHPYARPVIGRQEVIAAATPADLRVFYDAYYRPERAVLIVVGDVDSAQVEAKVKARFADWRGRGEPGRDPEPVRSPPIGSPVKIFAIPGQRTSNLIIVHPRPYEVLGNRPGDLMRRELQFMAESVYRQRIRDMAEADGKPFNATNGVREIRVPRVANLIVEESVSINDPTAAVALMVAARDQVLRFGVTESELRRQVDARLGQLNTAVSRAASLPTTGLANELVQNVVSGAIPVSAQDARALVLDIARQVKVSQINALLREELSGDGQLIFIGAEAPPGGEPALAEAIAKGHARSLAAYVPPAVKPWPYTDFGPAGQVVERREVADLNVTLVRFANGVRLTVRSSKGVKDQIFSSVRFGRGQLDFHKDRLTAEDYATFMVNESELAGLSRQEKAASLNGRATVQTFQRENAFEMANMAGSHPSNLDIQMQLYAAAITRPVWRMDGWASRLAQSTQAEAAAQVDPNGVFANQAPLLLHSGDMRWAINDAKTRDGWKPEEAVAFIAPILESAPLEVLLAGDVTADRAIDAVARTLGALPPRAETREPADLRKVRFPLPTPRPIVMHHAGPADRALVVVDWPTTDLYANPRDAIVASVLADVMRSRLFDQLRIAHGQTYSPSAYAQFSSNLPGYGLIGVAVAVQPQAVDQVFAEIDAIAADLAARAVTADELLRALTPRIETAKRDRLGNGYWMNILAGAQREPRALDLARDTVPILQTVTAADLLASAKKWLVRSKSWRVEVTPEAR